MEMKNLILVSFLCYLLFLNNTSFSETKDDKVHYYFAFYRTDTYDSNIKDIYITNVKSFTFERYHTSSYEYDTSISNSFLDYMKANFKIKRGADWDGRCFSSQEKAEKSRLEYMKLWREADYSFHKIYEYSYFT